MRRVTIKGLLAHKLRFALTALAVMLGVAFMSGTMVLTDTISRTFDNLFADVNRGTDAYVRSAQSLSSGFGERKRGPDPEPAPMETSSSAAETAHSDCWAVRVPLLVPSLAMRSFLSRRRARAAFDWSCGATVAVPVMPSARVSVFWEKPINAFAKSAMDL